MMNSGRKRQKRLDEELDLLVANGRRLSHPREIDEISDLVAAAQTMGQRDADQQHDPSYAFLRNLERQLMPATTPIDVHARLEPPNAARQLVELIRTRARFERSQHRKTSLLASFASAALVIAIIAATAFVALEGSNPETPTTPTLAGMIASTPDATTPNPDIAWMRPLPPGETLLPGDNTTGFGGLAAADGRVFRLIATTSFIGAEAIDPETGTLTWRQSLHWMFGGLAADASGVYLFTPIDSSGTMKVLALDPETGNQVWELPFKETIVSLTLIDGVIYLQTDDDRIQAIDPTTAKVTWQSEAIDSPDRTGPDLEVMSFEGVRPVVSGNYVIFISHSGAIIALDRQAGALQWQLDGYHAESTRLTTFQNLVVALTSAENWPVPLRLVAIDADTGTTQWQTGVNGPLVQPIALYYSIAVVGLVFSQEQIEADLAYTPSPSDEISDEISAGGSGQLINQSMIMGVSPENGGQQWTSFPNRNGGYLSMSTRLPGRDTGTLMAIGADGTLSALSGLKGTLGQLPIILGGTPIGPAYGFKEGVFVMLQDGTLVSLSTDYVLSIRG